MYDFFKSCDKFLLYNEISQIKFIKIYKCYCKKKLKKKK